ncbi:IclR family transcriptional regulator C-terminal domain-containing protein [Variovorax sp. J22P240]|uniref:IclR family transcriptional regulator domain-containing protein n=1 Tax=unclassified Variovorax TaxID=663243 RepID=UPI0025778D14|nr:MULTISPECIES: IclR family transcriptional regulator C-terminal domain-containing protein [unclassified Variovorax]MDL9999360.1 IclR family transcriptional regulator C-terminal domain-containing protein [Variovorax sp. J22P240]MDM0052524.1 IclR family transcriptional regulator C-terminal domain-containing protein [Variovorax sp. J22R115]
MSAHASPTSSTDAFPIEPEDHIEGLARGLSVIEAFDAAHSRMSASEVAARTGLSRTAARRHLLTLCHHGYANTDGKLFWLTARVLRLGESFLDAARVPRLVQPAIEHLSARTSETVNVSVLEGHDVVYISRSNSPRLVSVGFYPGLRVAAHVVTPGVALLATLDDNKLQRWVGEHVFTAFTSKTVTDPAVFLEHVRAARDLGYWIIEEHLDPALLGVAMAVRDRRGVAVAAISITLQMRSWSREQVIARLVPALSETAQSLRPLL